MGLSLKKTTGWGLAAFGALLCLALLTSHYVIAHYAKDKMYDKLEDVPAQQVGLVLGTSKRLKSGAPNPYYTNRILATTLLYKSNKIKFVLASGDNGSIYYNEPNTIKKDLIAAGIPADRIFLDYAGFRTLDSMVRAKEIFGLDSVTVISQKFHNERAIYLAGKKGLKAIGFNAKDVSIEAGLRVRVRESLARVKVFVDLALQTQPKFFGEKVTID
ncbi:vancomycin high temperature exclusion protein [Maribacter sp. 2307ULW6-5]|uniref:SanA/YdcF family protein n=1 Tax=Maribacter sp. 2307ULW6-5 TaxID=3386275 RepID=UPI0039BCCAF6